MANFEAFLSVIKLSANIFFLKSVLASSAIKIWTKPNAMVPYDDCTMLTWFKLVINLNIIYQKISLFKTYDTFQFASI